MAAIATVALVIASVLGGNNRQPSVADSSAPTEQTTEGNTSGGLPPIPDPEPVAAEPPISTAPIYVKATATSEAWVSIIADGNPTPIF